jgi:hypothetical protein
MSVSRLYSYETSGLCPAAQASPSLLAGVDSSMNKALIEAIDRLNRAYGRNAIYFGLMRLGRSWQMRRERKSSAFTTR